MEGLAAIGASYSQCCRKGAFVDESTLRVPSLSSQCRPSVVPGDAGLGGYASASRRRTASWRCFRPSAAQGPARPSVTSASSASRRCSTIRACRPACGPPRNRRQVPHLVAIRISTLRDVRPGEELTHSYTDVACDSVAARAAQLRVVVGVHCRRRWCGDAHRAHCACWRRQRRRREETGRRVDGPGSEATGAGAPVVPVVRQDHECRTRSGSSPRHGPGGGVVGAAGQLVQADDGRGHVAPLVLRCCLPSALCA
jgi:hypothetical protein